MRPHNGEKSGLVAPAPENREHTEVAIAGQPFSSAVETLSKPRYFRLNRSVSFAHTPGLTNALTSPPSRPISFTNREEMN